MSTPKPREMREEATAIRRLLEVALGSMATKTVAQFVQDKVIRGATRLEDAARKMEAGNGQG